MWWAQLDFAQNIARLQSRVEEYHPALLAPSAHVLIVDDNEMNLEVIASLLEDTRMQIMTAESGSECLEILKTRSFHLIFLDVN